MVNKRTYYHAAAYDDWPSIKLKGLVPYPVVENRDEEEGIISVMVEYGLEPKGVFLWPASVVNTTLIQDFLYWKWGNRAKTCCYILKCEVDPLITLDYHVNQEGSTIGMCHSQSGSSNKGDPIRFHQNVLMTLALETIPPQDIVPIYKVFVGVEQLTDFALTTKVPDYKELYDQERVRQKRVVKALKGEDWQLRNDS